MLTADHLAQAAAAKFAGWQDEQTAAATGADYAARVQVCLDRWQLTAESLMSQGMGLPVLGVRDQHGGSAVLKLGWEDGFDHQVHTLQAAQGRGYARVLGWAPDQQAVLLEQLGASLGEHRLGPERELQIQVAALQLAWQVQVDLPDQPAWLRGDKAEGLRGFLADEAHRAPEYAAVIARVDQLAQTLTGRGRHPVLVHGDPHVQNLLRRPEEGDGAEHWAFIDPDGFACDAAYDLGVTLRHFSGELLALEASSGPDAVAAQLQTWADLLAERTRVAADLIFDWALLERVTTGLYLLKFGRRDEGITLLHLAQVICRGDTQR